MNALARKRARSLGGRSLQASANEQGVRIACEVLVNQELSGRSVAAIRRCTFKICC